MRRSARPLVLAAALALASSAGAAPLTAHGRFLRDGRGRIVFLHGLFAAWKQPPYYPLGQDSASDPSAPSFTPADADRVRALGLDGVRLAWFWQGLEPSPGAYSRTYLDGIAAVQEKLAARGIYTVLDAHQDQYDELFGNKPGFPGWSAITDGKALAPLPSDPAYAAWKFPLGYFKASTERAFASLYANREFAPPAPRGVRDAFGAAWAHVAARFRRARMVAGYDLVNEPFPAQLSDAEPYATACGTAAGCAAYEQSTLEPFELALARAVRRVDRRRTVFLEPTFFFNSGSPAHFTAAPRGLGSVGFSFHNQCPTRTQYSLTHDPALIEAGHRICPPIETGVMRNADRTAAALGGPPLMTEVAPTADADAQGLECLLERADRFQTGWTYGLSWSNPDDELRRLHDESAPGAGSAYKELVLARVYPRAVAGRPLWFGFDVRTGVFEMTYVARRGGQVPTVISVPAAIQYPRGYEVSVSGGHVTSAPGSPRLTVVPGRGARIVRVRVAPRGPDAVARPAWPACA